MRKLELLSACAIALAFAAGGANAATDFTYTGAAVTWVVPTTGFYQITAYGAQGADVRGQDTPDYVGGRGAEVGGETFLAAGTVVNIVVGGAGNNTHGDTANGGGGGSWVFTDIPLAIAGGGGGAAYDGGGGGQDGQITSGTGLGGIGHDGGGGGGWLGNGSDGGSAGNGGHGYGTGGAGPLSFAGGDTFVCSSPNSCIEHPSTGGFGGGGGSGWDSGGGGGGYTGGDGAGSSSGFGLGGGGGTSYLDASFLNTFGVVGARSGNGFVHISDVLSGPVPEPTTWALMLTGFLGAGVALRRRRRADGARTA